MMSDEMFGTSMQDQCLIYDLNLMRYFNLIPQSLAIYMMYTHDYYKVIRLLKCIYLLQQVSSAVWKV